ncbi:hypothetical protein FSARC_9742 [Fusarium sarcochroum]|uniref:Zn(2)-C6 fungal-type domain-containing protein n=1 Tax=Fusarium sarcochroum TaxID=1208366 RepID=A0A8H4TQH6_9HYPO|nr:hypothetical protein FSARC_9742 [Fusarium sarcochroum]
MERRSVPRLRQACEGCRQKKTKCSGEKPMCSFCERLGQTCTYLERERDRRTGGMRRKLSPENSDPSPELLYHLVKVYREHLYFQPLPLFDVDRIHGSLQSFPSFLRWAFLAIALRFIEHPIYGGRTTQANKCYIASRNAVMQLALDGVRKVEMACVQEHASHGQDFNDPDSSRCHWSIKTLEAAFSSHPGAQVYGVDPPNCPPSPARPPPLSTVAGTQEHPNLFDSNEVNGRDYGINAYCLQRVQIWGEIVSYMESIRTGKVDSSSLASHNQLTMRMYEVESKLSYQHLFRKVSFQHRRLPELSANREYWTPWLLMQMSYHAAQAALNHPFIHLVALRGSQGVSQSRSFLQETLDRALFHSSWVFRFIHICEKLEFDITDPLIGQIVAATATIPWLFQFVRDEAISSRARQDFETCERALSRISAYWPHIAQMCQTLRELQSTIKQRDDDTKVDNSTVQFSPDAVWRLLSPHATAVSHPSVCYHSSPGHSVSTATLQITTTIVHPATEDESSQPPKETGVDAHDGQMDWEDFFDKPYLTNMLWESLVADYSWLPFH